MNEIERIRNQSEGRVFAFLANQREPVSSLQIVNGICGRNCEIYSALGRLTAMNILYRQGSGCKGNAYKYAVSVPFEINFILDDKNIEKQINDCGLIGEVLN